MYMHIRTCICTELQPTMVLQDVRYVCVCYKLSVSVKLIMLVGGLLASYTNIVFSQL